MEEPTLIAAIISASLVAKPIAETGCRLLESLLGRPLKIAGGMLADEFYGWRWRNRINIAARGAQIMANNNVAAKVLPKGFLLPLLEAAGDIDDPELQQMWAQLIASGIERDDARHPAFVPTLREMTPLEARFLTDLNDLRFVLAYVWDLDRAVAGVVIEDTVSTKIADLEQLSFALMNLERLKLVDAGTGYPFHSLPAERVEHYGEVEEKMKRLQKPTQWALPMNGYVRMNSFGRAFAKACIGEPR